MTTESNVEINPLKISAADALSMATSENYYKLSYQMRFALNILKKNNVPSEIYKLGFSEVDINFQEFLETSGLSEKEQDLMYITNSFRKAWNTLHVAKIKKVCESTTEDDKILLKVFTLMKKYNLQHHLLSNDSVILSEEKFMEFVK